MGKIGKSLAVGLLVFLCVVSTVSIVAIKPVFAVPKLLYISTISYQNTTGTIKASQGETEKVNVTLQSMCSEQIAIPVENITLAGYDSTLNYNSWAGTGGWNPAIAQRSVFNYSFSLNQLVLQPHMSNSTIMTIKWANNTPTGTYSFELNLGKFEFLTPPQQFDQSYANSVSFGIVLTPQSLAASPTESANPTASPAPTVPELSGLIILPLFLIAILIATKLGHRNKSDEHMSSL